jgi:hypothetical protein
MFSPSTEETGTMIKESQIVAEGKHHWIMRHDKGWLEVLRIGVTHSTRVATIGRFEPERQLALAMAEMARRDAIIDAA